METDWTLLITDVMTETRITSMAVIKTVMLRLGSLAQEVPLPRKTHAQRYVGMVETLIPRLTNAMTVTQ